MLLVLEQMSQREAPTVGFLCFQRVPACQCHTACFHGRLDRGHLLCLSAVLCGLGMFGSLSTMVPVMLPRESGLQPQNLLGGRDLCVKEKHAAVLFSFVYHLLVVVLFRVAKSGSGSSIYQQMDKENVTHTHTHACARAHTYTQ